MEHVDITLTGVANVKITKNVTLPKSEAEKLLSDDGKIQALLTRHNPIEVKSWGHVFGEKQREFTITKPEPGYSCANHFCGWVGIESDKAEVEKPGGSVSTCPECGGSKFYTFQRVVPRG
ncbi:hypothetical protein [Pseudoalteromonas umbrosa]|uniref:hypothetical protein n=1 Tax=Pseudoalteromonas umbrosa TaxID=3048489 RepID=UPI0024C3212C|nr:hypothetical protein [Pseudoalteromonas sp. B95]MDK1288524.1 hypothetical protein [Pseudoalteromonas sp. B95]